jgi:hypothetical protein
VSVTPPAPDDPFATTAATPAEPQARGERWPVPLLALLTAIGLALGLAGTDGPARGGGAREQIGDGGSLVTPGNLRAAVERSSEVAGSDRLVGLRVSPEDVQARWLISEERTRANGQPATVTSVRSTYVDRTGRVEVVGSDTIDPDPGEAIAVADVPYGAPTAIGETLALATAIGPGSLDYVLLDPGGDRWTAYLDAETDAVERLNPIVASLDGNAVTPKGPGADE